MLSLEDCIALCGLFEDEVLAIAEHKHIPQVAAAELGNYLTQTPEGEMRIKSIIREDIAHARRCGNRARRLVSLTAQATTATTRVQSRADTPE